MTKGCFSPRARSVNVRAGTPVQPVREDPPLRTQFSGAGAATFSSVRLCGLIQVLAGEIEHRFEFLGERVDTLVSGSLHSGERIRPRRQSSA
jgi:hypothetical protein